MNDHCENWWEQIRRRIDGGLQENGIQLGEHLEQCRTCRDYHRALMDDHQHLAGYTASLDDVVSRIEDRVIENLALGTDATDQEEMVKVIPLRRKIMNTIMTRYGAAAAVLLAVVAGFGVLNQMNDTGVAWAEVLKQVTAARSVVFKTLDENGKEIHKIRIRRSADDCSVFEAYINGNLEMRVIKDPANQTLLTLLPGIKRYARHTLSDEKIREHWRWEDPGLLVKRILSHEHSELGLREVDGVRVVGIETSDPDFIDGVSSSLTLRLWVDAETSWPVLMESVRRDAAGNKLEVLRYGEFSWNTDLESMVVATDVPADYRTHFDLGNFILDESHALAGLELYASYMDRYPERLDNSLVDGLELGEKLTSAERPAGPMQDPFDQIKSFYEVCMFFNQLIVHHRDVAYFGDRVSPGEEDLVLWRWRLDDGNYRVIYGDLTAETVSPELLEQLEN